MAKKQGINIVPLGDRVVVRRESAEETTAGGIVLPDSAQDKPQRGEVVATCSRTALMRKRPEGS